jgi:hypothetical protein
MAAYNRHTSPPELAENPGNFFLVDRYLKYRCDIRERARWARASELNIRERAYV